MQANYYQEFINIRVYIVKVNKILNLQLLSKNIWMMLKQPKVQYFLLWLEEKYQKA